MRGFLAVELDSETRTLLCNIQQQLKNEGIRGNYTLPENFHLTNKFLGEIDEVEFGKIKGLIKNVASRHNPFVLSLNFIGKFEKGNKIIFWAGLRRNESLQNIYRDVELLLEPIQPSHGEKNFSPHITLVREAVSPKVFSEIKTIKEGLEHVFPASGLSLMESTRVEGQLTYIRRAFEPFLYE